MADGVNIDTLQIEIEASSTTAAGAIDRLTASLQRLGQATKVPGLEKLSRQMKALTQMPNTSTAKIEQEIARLEKQAEESANSVLKLQKRLEDAQQYRGIGTPATAAGVEAEIKKTEAEIERLSGVIDAADGKIRQLRQSLETGMQGAAAPIEQVAEALAKIPQQAPAAFIDNEGIKKAAASCERLAASAERMQKSLERTGGSTDKLAGAAQKVQKASANVDNVAKAAKRVETGLSGATKEAERLGHTVKRAGDQGASGLDRLVDRLKRLTMNFVIFRLISRLTNAVAENLGNVAKRNERVNETLSKIVTSVQYLVDALTAAVLPVLMAIEPVITAILDGLASVLNFIARIVAAFLGEDYVMQARKEYKDFAGSVDDATSSTDKLTGAAKKLKSALLGIDELNIIEKDPPMGGGGSSGDKGGFRFEEVKNDLKFPEIKFPNLDAIPSPEWTPNPIPAPEFEPVTLPELSGAKLKAPSWVPELVKAPAFEPLTVPNLAGERLLSPEWVPSLVPSPVFEPVLLPDLVGQKLPAPVWEPGFVPAPVFEPLPVPDLLGQKLPSPSWAPDVIRSPVFEPVRLPELVGEMLKSPAWFPSVIPAPVFEKLLIPSFVGALLTSPAWAPSIIPAPLFEALTLPEWALSPLPVPEWAQNPIPAPAIDSSLLLSGLAAIGEAFASLETRVGEKLQVLQQKFSSFVTFTQTSLATWGQNLKTNFSSVIEFIPKVTPLALSPTAKLFGGFFSVTAAALGVWGPNLAKNFGATLDYLGSAAVPVLSSLGTSIVSWVNQTSSAFGSWGGSLIATAAKAGSGLVQNLMSAFSSAWDGFVGLMQSIGEKISSWWSANKSWAAPVGAVALAGAGVAAFVLSGGASAVAAAIPHMAPLTLPAMAFANGGVVKSPTLALMGEYPNARSDPEIISPQSILRQTFREEQGRQDYSDVISAVNAGFQALIETINNQDYSVHLDGKTLMQSVERAQRQRGANIMGGGVLG